MNAMHVVNGDALPHKVKGRGQEAMAKQKGLTQLTSVGDSFGRYYEHRPWFCSAFPTRAHYWLIEGRGVGQCRYCGEKRQFTTSAASSYSELREIGESRRCDSVTLEDTLRELLHMPEVGGQRSANQ